MINSSRQLFQRPGFITDMFGYNVVDHAVPFGVFTVGIVTLVCVLLGFLYLQKKALQSAVRERANNSTQQQTDSSEEEEQAEESLDHWPLDEVPSMKKNPDLSEKEIDALKFCGHIPSEIKKAQVKATQKKIEQEMTAEQKEEERRLQRDQLKAIFEMMAEQQDKFGVGSPEELSEQMRLYM